MGAVRGIGFDLDHTLAIDNRLERVAFMQLLDGVLAQGGHAVGTFGDEMNAIDALLHRQRTSDLTIDEAVRLFVTQHGVECSESLVESFRTSALERIEEFVIPLPGVRQAIETLRERGIAIAVLTNGWNPLQEDKARKAGFDGPILVSSEIGARKPSPRAFERLLDVLGSAPQATWYVGDDPYSDVAGAREAGMQTVWMNWDAGQYPPELAPPTHTITSFAQLLELVPELVSRS